MEAAAASDRFRRGDGDFELEAVRVVQEDGVVAGRVVVLAGTALDLRSLFPQPEARSSTSARLVAEKAMWCIPTA